MHRFTLKYLKLICCLFISLYSFLLVQEKKKAIIVIFMLFRIIITILIIKNYWLPFLWSPDTEEHKLVRKSLSSWIKNLSGWYNLLQRISDYQFNESYLAVLYVTKYMITLKTTGTWPGHHRDPAETLDIWHLLKIIKTQNIVRKLLNWCWNYK